MVDSKITKKLVSAFPKSFINGGLEFVAELKSNQYFRLEDIYTEFEVKCKVLEWLSRAAFKTAPYATQKSNDRLHKYMLDGINEFLETNFTYEDMEIIYTYLGNCCNHIKTMEFINSGYNMAVLKRGR